MKKRAYTQTIRRTMRKKMQNILHVEPPLETKFEPKPEFRNEYMAMHASSVEFAKSSIQCMFLANGGAVTALLLNFDVQKFIFPIIIFSLGIAYSILLPIFMQFRTESSLEKYFNTGINPVKFIQSSLISRLISHIFMYIPAILFFYGMYISTEVLN